MRTKPTKTPVMYKRIKRNRQKKTAAKTNPTINNQPFNPSLYKAIANAVKPIMNLHLEWIKQLKLALQ